MYNHQECTHNVVVCVSECYFRLSLSLLHARAIRHQSFISCELNTVLDDSLEDFKNELIKRLDHIQQLAKQKNYAEIEKLLEEGYV